MSWDFSVLKAPAEIESVEQFPADFVLEKLGPRNQLITQILGVLPETDFSDPIWGIYSGSGFSLEFNMGNDEISDGFMIHVRGGGDAPLAIQKVLTSLNLRAIDCSTGEFFTLEESSETFKQWQAFRDKVIGRE